jgi:hypothetical protein
MASAFYPNPTQLGSATRHRQEQVPPRAGSTRKEWGLVELIVLNLGYDLGILSPRIFAMMVVMALVTTFMTGPLLNLLDAVWERVPVMPGRSRLT